jgi:hypothetical protein
MHLHQKPLYIWKRAAILDMGKGISEGTFAHTALIVASILRGNNGVFHPTSADKTA